MRINQDTGKDKGKVRKKKGGNRKNKEGGKEKLEKRLGNGRIEKGTKDCREHYEIKPP